MSDKNPSTPAQAGHDITVTATADGIKTQTREAVEVVSKGVGQRDLAPAQVPVPAAPPKVTVTEDVDFEALMAGATEKTDNAFEPGDRVTGVVEVISLHGPEVFLDLGGPATGYVLKEELLRDDGTLKVSQGDTIEGIVVGTNSSGVHIRMKLGAAGGDMSALKDAHEGNLPVEGKVVSTNKGGYEVLVAGQRAFCPFSQIDVHRPEDPETFVGRVMTFRITEIRPGSVVVSRLALMREELAVKAAETMKKLSVGARMTGTVSRLQKFGAFVDLGGIDGLIHVSEMSWSRVGDPSSVLSVGQKVEVVVLEINPEKQRIALSLKQAQGDPFEGAVESIQRGAVVNGKVSRLTDFGAFIELAPHVDGLVHVSDMAHHRIRHPKELLTVGDTVQVKVMEIDLGRRRIGLSLKALAADPWDSITSNYKPDQTVKGMVESIQTFGVFVTLEAGVTALLPASESGVPQGKPLTMEFRVGKEIEAKILRVDADNRKIALTKREGRRSEHSGGGGGGGGGRGGRDGRGRGPRRDGGGGRGAPRTYLDAEADKDGEGLGSFGALLMQAMGKDDDKGKGKG